MRVPEDALREAGIVDRAVVTAREGRRAARPGSPAERRSCSPISKVSPERLVEIAASTRRFGRDVALDDVTAAFSPGRLSVVTGPSGSGKSTLLSLSPASTSPTRARW